VTGPETDEYEVRFRPRTTLRTVLAVALVVAVFCCGGLGVGGYLLSRKLRNAQSPIRASAEAFLDDLESGDYAAAYDRLCRATRERFSRDAFAAAVSGTSAVRAHHIDQVKITNDGVRLGGSVTTTLVDASGVPRTHALPMTSESRAWKVCGEPY
jgi:hypothetical protein